MTEADFHNIAARNDTSKAERLFRASVSAFCTLTRPSRREVTQLDDLALPLYPHVSSSARRFVAAALSECEIAPPRLVDLLVNDRVDIAAPLLMRSALLTDIDLIALIGRHGLPHARAIARRPGLNLTILHLIRALEASARTRAQTTPSHSEAAEAHARSSSIATGSPAREPPRAVERPHAASVRPDLANPKPASETNTIQSTDYSARSLPLAEIAARGAGGGAAEAVRQQLREMMSKEPTPRETDVGLKSDAHNFARLRDAAFTGDATLFHAALGDALGMTVSLARKITETSSYAPLLAALRALDLGEEQAFMLAAAVFPGQFAHPESIRLFTTRYKSLGQETAAERVRGWKSEALDSQVQWEKARRDRA